MEDLLIQGAEKGTADMRSLKYSVVDKNKAYRGEMQVGVTFTLKVFFLFFFSLFFFFKQKLKKDIKKVMDNLSEISLCISIRTVVLII